MLLWQHHVNVVTAVAVLGLKHTKTQLQAAAERICHKHTEPAG